MNILEAKPKPRSQGLVAEIQPSLPNLSFYPIALYSLVCERVLFFSETQLDMPLGCVFFSFPIIFAVREQPVTEFGKFDGVRPPRPTSYACSSKFSWHFFAGETCARDLEGEGGKIWR